MNQTERRPRTSESPTKPRPNSAKEAGTGIGEA